MFTNNQRQEERTGKHGTPRLQYLQELVSQFQNATDEETKERIAANLANFAYDPYNYTILRQLNVLELFIDCITEPNEKLVEFGIGGICNACAEPKNVAAIVEADGIPLVIKCLSSPVRNTVNYALGALYYMCDYNRGTREKIIRAEVIDLIKREGRMREATRLFRDIKGVVTVNHVTYTSLIDGYCRMNDIDEALRLREVMEARGFSPGVVTYNSILRKLCEDGRIREANRLLTEMSGKKIEPDNITCNTLINAYCKIGDMVSAVKVKKKMIDSGLKLDLYSYKALVHGFCKVLELENAKEELSSMLQKGLSPGYSTYSWLVDGFYDQKKQDEIMRLPEEFEKRGICPDVALYRGLSNLHVINTNYSSGVYERLPPVVNELWYDDTL